MKEELTLRAACELSYKLWCWLFQNPGKDKKDSPYLDEIEHYENLCPLCEISSCDECPGGSPGFYCFGRAYCHWATRECNKRYSAHIAFTIRKFMVKNGWYNEK